MRQTRFGPGQMQPAGVGTEKVDERQDAADALTQGSGGCRALESPGEYRDKEGIQHHVGHTCRYGHVKAQLWLFSGGKEALKFKLKHVGRDGGQDDLPIEDALFQQLTLGSQRCGDRTQKKEACRGQNHTAGQGDPYPHGEQPVCLLRFAFAHGFGNQGAASGAE